MTGHGTPLDLVRHTRGAARVINVELLFDLVYVFAVTQLSHHLLPHPTITVCLAGVVSRFDAPAPVTRPWKV